MFFTHSLYPITATELESRTLEVSAWHQDIVGRNYCIGVALLPLDTRHWNGKYMTQWLCLDKKMHVTDVNYPMPFQPYRGDVVLSFKYVPAKIVIKEELERQRGNANVQQLPNIPEDKDGSDLMKEFLEASYKHSVKSEQSSKDQQINLKKNSVTDFTGQLHVSIEEARNLIPVRSVGNFQIYVGVKLRPFKSAYKETDKVIGNQEPLQNNHVRFKKYHK